MGAVLEKYGSTDREGSVDRNNFGFATVPVNGIGVASPTPGARSLLR